MELFYQHGLTSTAERTGVLLYVALLERRVEVVADVGIHEKVGPTAWQSIIDGVISAVHQGSVAEGICTGIRACGDLLKTHFPAREGKPQRTA